MARGDRLRELLDRLHPSGLLYATYEHRLIAELNPDQLPEHVAVLADGNRRWARANAPGQPLVTGYQAGADKLTDFVDWCDEVRIKIVTLWVLSTDNFLRDTDDEIGPLLEVVTQMVEHLAVRGSGRPGDGYRKIRCVGALDLLPDDIHTRLKAAQEHTAQADGMVVNIAVSYGGRHELRDAFRSLLSEQAARGTPMEQLASNLEIDDIAKNLYTAGQPDPDLIIRTSGEQRLSGFLLWQSAHSEYYFCEALWPDFRKVDFIRALRAYGQRERRFGR